MPENQIECEYMIETYGHQMIQYLRNYYDDMTEVCGDLGLCE